MQSLGFFAPLILKFVVKLLALNNSSEKVLFSLREQYTKLLTEDVISFNLCLHY